MVNFISEESESSLSQQWVSQTGKRWVVGEGLVSSHLQHTSVLLEETVSSYQRVVRSQGLWMSFSRPTPFNTDSFSRLETLMAQDATVTGKIILIFIILFLFCCSRWFLLLLGRVSLQDV